MTPRKAFSEKVNQWLFVLLSSGRCKVRPVHCC